MPKNKTIKFSRKPTYDFQAINRLATAKGVKRLSPSQLNKMSKSDIDKYIKYLKTQSKMDGKQARSASKTFRKNMKAAADANFREQSLTHGTIRQAIAETGLLGAQGVATAATPAISNPNPSNNSVDQNVSGGSNSVGNDTEQGPVYAYGGREED